MKKFNKAVSLAVAAALVMASLIGCSGNAADNNMGSTNAEDTSTDAAADTNTDAAADTGVADAGTAATDGAVFKIGGIGPVTGDAAEYGMAVMNAAQIAVDEINAAGGINGVMIEYNFQDDELDSEKAVNAYNTLKDWGMNILMGTVTSGCCVAVADKTSADNMFQITPSGSSVSIIENNDNVFQICFTDPNQGIGSAQYIGGMEGISKIAVIYNSSDVYSSGIYEKFAVEAKNQPFEVVASEAFTSDNKTDFSVQLQKAKDAGAELVFLPIYYAEASLILTQAASMDYTPIFFGCDGLDGILGMENFDISLAEDVILLTPFAADATDDQTKAFVAEYQKRFNSVPNQFAADAYDAIYVIAAAIEASGVTPDMTVSEIGDGLKTIMPTLNVDGLTGTGMTWNAEGEVDKEPKAMIIKNGIYSLIQ